MTDQLRDLSDADGIDAHHAAASLPVDHHPTTARRTRVALVALVTAVSVAVMIGAAVGVSRSLGDDPTTSSASPEPVASTLAVSGAGVGDLRFGTDAEQVVEAVTARFGEPDVSVEPTAYSRIAGRDGWFEVADDPLSPSWRHRVVSVSCWDTLCLVLGGSDPDALRLRGWELSRFVRWSESGRPGDPSAPDVRLARTGIRLGDSWATTRAAYPDVTIGGGEGASLTVRDTPWPGIFDGVGEWRLSGQWDPDRPTTAPPGARITRLSGGEGPQPGCC